MRGTPLDDFLSHHTPDFAFAVTSLPERVVEAVDATKAAAKWQAQTRAQFARLYPSPLRVSSLNFDPMAAWRMGVQMAGSATTHIKPASSAAHPALALTVAGARGWDTLALLLLLLLTRSRRSRRALTVAGVRSVA
jgi:hypothetical protein